MSCNCVGYTNAGLMGGAYNDAVLDGGYMLNPTNLNKTYMQALITQAESETPGTMDALRRLQATRSRPKKTPTLSPAKKRALLAKMNGKGFLGKIIGWALKGNFKRIKELIQTKKDQKAEIERLKAKKAAQGGSLGPKSTFNDLVAETVAQIKAAQGKGALSEEEILERFRPWHTRPAKNPMVGNVNTALMKKKLAEGEIPDIIAKPHRTGGVGSTRKRSMGAGKQCMGGSKLKKFFSDLKTLFGTPIMPLNIALLVKKKQREAEIEKLKKEVGEA